MPGPGCRKKRGKKMGDWKVIAVACIASVVGVGLGALIIYCIQKMQRDSAQKGAEKIRKDYSSRK